MNKNTARIACVALIIALLGVTIYGEIQTKQKPAIQAGTDTPFVNSRRGNGVGTNGPTEESNKPNSGTKYGDTTGSHGGDSQAELATRSDQDQKESTDMENGGLTLNRGAGNINNVTVDDSLYYYNAAELEKGLLHDLKPLALLFIQAQEKYGIDAVFLAAIAAEESGWGRYQFRQNNIFGFEGFDFDSLEECIDYVASFLSKQYLTPGAKYYEGTSVAAVNTYYNGRDTWEEHITQIMNNIIKRIERTDNE